MADFATVAELEAFMATSGLGARGTALLTYASALIRREAGQDLDEVTGRQEEWAGTNRHYIFVTQVPVTAVTEVEVDGVTFDDFGWTRWGRIYREDCGPWDTGPIIVTYDSGYEADSAELADVKTICLEVAARAIAGPTGSSLFGAEVPEYRGDAPTLQLTSEERARLLDLGMVGVG